MEVAREAGSYRDPAGYVFYRDGRVFRAVTERARADYEAVRGNTAVRALMGEGVLVGSRELAPDEANSLAPDAAYVVEHEPIPFISYPFEWPFALLQRAARFHLDLHLRLLDAGITLSDATAYNVQFRGSRPVFIDLLSLRPYREGELWAGHHQFMQQFVQPLLLNALARVPYGNWYKGNLDGIRRDELARCLPLRSRLSPRVMRHVILPRMLERESRESGGGAARAGAPARLEKPAFLAMLRELDAWLASLRPGTAAGTTWADYERTRTYETDEVERKKAAVAEFIGAQRPALVWDLGCNTGEFAEVALRSGAGRAVGFDADEGALHLASERAARNGLDFLPLAMDLMNPTPGSGWRGRERTALLERARPDAILALALIHHLAIGGNVPLGEAVAWLVSLAPLGVIEFVQKNDETVREMLRFREDIFDDYTEETFRSHLEAVAEVRERREVSAAGRVLYFFRRR